MARLSFIGAAPSPTVGSDQVNAGPHTPQSLDQNFANLRAAIAASTGQILDPLSLYQIYGIGPLVAGTLGDDGLFDSDTQGRIAALAALGIPLQAISVAISSSSGGGPVALALSGDLLFAASVLAEGGLVGVVQADSSAGGSVLDAGSLMAANSLSSDNLISASALDIGGLLGSLLGNGLASACALDGGVFSYAAPDSFVLNPVTGAVINTSILSNLVTISGLAGTVPVSISGVSGFYRRNGGNWTAAAGVVANGDTLQLFINTPNSYNSTTTVTLSVGSFSTDFSVTTLAGTATGDNLISNSVLDAGGFAAVASTLIADALLSGSALNAGALVGILSADSLTSFSVLDAGQLSAVPIISPDSLASSSSLGSGQLVGIAMGDTLAGASTLATCTVFGILSADPLASASALDRGGLTAAATAPAAPTVSASNSPSQLTTTWNPVSGATSYNGWYGTSNPPTIEVVGVNSPWIILSGLTPGVTYYTAVSSVNASGESVKSNAAAAAAAAPVGISSNVAGTYTHTFTSDVFVTVTSLAAGGGGGGGNYGPGSDGGASSITRGSTVLANVSGGVGADGSYDTGANGSVVTNSIGATGGSAANGGVNSNDGTAWGAGGEGATLLNGSFTITASSGSPVTLTVVVGAGGVGGDSDQASNSQNGGDGWVNLSW